MEIRTRVATGALALSAALLASAAIAQQPAAPPAAAAPAPQLFPSSASPSPTYVTIPMEITVDRPAAQVWARVGKYCDIAEWLQIASGCTITAGTAGEFGAVRTVGREILVGKTELSYTYTQPVRQGAVYNLYHGTLEARPLTPTTSKIVYTLIYDNSQIPVANRDADLANRRTTFMRAMNNMKILAEGGTLPPPPAPAGRGGAAAATPAPARGN